MPSLAPPNATLEPTPHVVKPRERTARLLPVLSIVGDSVLSESGEVRTLDEIRKGLSELPPTLFAKLGAAQFVSELNSYYLLHDPEHWQYRAGVYERVVVRPDGKKIGAKVSVVIHYFGFRGSKNPKSGGGTFHQIIDPVVMYGKKLDEIWPADDGMLQITRLLQWAVNIRDFCAENNLNMRPTIGSISAQFLTDPRFYPKARRKVPAKINKRVREYMPGNYYNLNVTPGTKTYRAEYLDQHRAHHYHARTIALPDANTLYAHGYFKNLEDIQEMQPRRDFHGLYCLDMEVPKYVPFLWYKPGTYRQAFVFSNELSHLQDVGVRVLGIRAAWGSFRTDTGLANYARWAESQLDSYQDAPWLKPLLLSVYGVLAVRPSYGESIFRLANGGTPVTLPTGRRQLTGKLVKRPMKLEPGIANVLHRGMIEAATRSESALLAQWLDSLGHHILHIYADAVIVEANDDKPLPELIPEPWRLKRTLNNLQIINQQAFVSDGMTKLPGVGRELMKYRQHTKPGHAPRVIQYEALTNHPVLTDRRI